MSQVCPPSKKKMVNTFSYVFCHLYIFYGKVSVQIFCPVLNWVVSFLTEFSELYILSSFLFLTFLVFLGLHPQHMEVPRLGVESELYLQAYTIATAMWNPNQVCDLHHSSQQCRILNPLSEARDQTHNLMIPSQIRFRCTISSNGYFSFHFESTISAVDILGTGNRQGRS